VDAADSAGAAESSAAIDGETVTPPAEDAKQGSGRPLKSHGGGSGGSGAEIGDSGVFEAGAFTPDMAEVAGQGAMEGFSGEIDDDGEYHDYEYEAGGYGDDVYEDDFDDDHDAAAYASYHYRAEEGEEDEEDEEDEEVDVLNRDVMAARAAIAGWRCWEEGRSTMSTTTRGLLIRCPTTAATTAVATRVAMGRLCRPSRSRWCRRLPTTTTFTTTTSTTLTMRSSSEVSS
jgi:hypothetical protein